MQGLHFEGKGLAVQLNSLALFQGSTGWHYAADFEDICVYYYGEIQNDLTPKEYYPQCDDCKDKEKIPKNKQNKT